MSDLEKCYGRDLRVGDVFTHSQLQRPCWLVVGLKHPEYNDHPLVLAYRDGEFGWTASTSPDSTCYRRRWA